MIPKKPKETIAEFAEQSGIKYEDAELIVTEFWTEVNRVQHTLEKDGLIIPGFGIFFIKIWTLKKKIINITNRLPSIKTDRVRDKLTSDLKLFQDTVYKCGVVWQEKLDKKLKKKQDNDTKRKIPDSMGEQESDS